MTYRRICQFLIFSESPPLKKRICSTSAKKDIVYVKVQSLSFSYRSKTGNFVHGYITIYSFLYNTGSLHLHSHLLNILVLMGWLLVREGSSSIPKPSQEPRHTKDVIKMVPVFPLFEHLKGNTKEKHSRFYCTNSYIAKRVAQKTLFLHATLYIHFHLVHMRHLPYPSNMYLDILL